MKELYDDNEVKELYDDNEVKELYDDNEVKEFKKKLLEALFLEKIPEYYWRGCTGSEDLDSD